MELKRFKITTNSKNTKRIAPNLLGRNFKSARPDLVWVGDVTYIPTRDGWLYLAILLDLYSRKIIGWSMSERNNKKLALNALNMALEKRNPTLQTLHHTDQGNIYGSDKYRERLDKAGLITSMSRKGDCWDNAVAESFFSTLEHELINGQVFRGRDIARQEIFKFIEIYYNRKRIHQSLGYITPEMMETQMSHN
ncbi:IS3 family transposase [Candidatus Omnitrophota bacterium]